MEKKLENKMRVIANNPQRDLNAEKTNKLKLKYV